jgi:peptidyl-prolyl cis-trans isomerase SurA
MKIAGTIVAALFLGLAAQAQSANPYAPVRTINGDVITDYDIAQRASLLDALGAEGNLQDLALEQLTEDRLKLQSGDQIGFELPEDAVLGGIEEFAGTRGIGVDDVFRILDARNIDRQAMDDYVEAGLVWREVVSARFRELSIPTDAEVDAALAIEANTPINVYVLGEIALPYAERGRAETDRLAEELYRDLALGGDFTAAVRQFSRSESVRNDGRVDPMPLAAMPGPLRAAVQPLAPGEVSAPVEISGGVAILKVLEIRKELPARGPNQTEFDRREAMRRQLFSERITAFGEGYLQELRSDAIIVER